MTKIDGVAGGLPLRIGAEERLVGGAPAAGAPEATFGGLLERTVNEANAAQQAAVAKAEALADGRSDDLHGTMISMKEAEISLKLVGTVRNKLLDAFHELWRINV